MSAREFTQNIAHDILLRRKIFKILTLSFVTLSMFYVYLIGSITFNVMARKSLEANSVTLSSRVGTMELEFISLTNSIDSSFGKEHGYTEAQGTIFVKKGGAPVALR